MFSESKKSHIERELLPNLEGISTVFGGRAGTLRPIVRGKKMVGIKEPGLIIVRLFLVPVLQCILLFLNLKTKGFHTMIEVWYRCADAKTGIFRNRSDKPYLLPFFRHSLGLSEKLFLKAL